MSGRATADILDEEEAPSGGSVSILPAKISVWVTGHYPSRPEGSGSRGPVSGLSRPPYISEVLDRKPYSFGRPDVSHHFLDFARMRLGRYVRRQKALPRSRDRLKRFRQELWFLVLAGYSPSLIRDLFQEVLSKAFESLSYGGVVGSIKELVLVAEAGEFLLEEEYCELLEDYKTGPWALDAPDWLRKQYGVPLPGEVSSKRDSGKQKGFVDLVSGQGSGQSFEPVVGLEQASPGVQGLAGFLHPGPGGYNEFQLLFMEGLFKQMMAGFGGFPVPAGAGGVCAGGGGTGGAPGVFSPAGVISPASETGGLSEKSRKEKRAELDEDIASYEESRGSLALTPAEYFRALDLGLSVVLAERASGTRPADPGSGDLSVLTKEGLPETPAETSKVVLGGGETQALVDPVPKAKPDDSADGGNEPAELPAETGDVLLTKNESAPDQSGVDDGDKSEGDPDGSSPDAGSDAGLKDDSDQADEADEDKDLVPPPGNESVENIEYEDDDEATIWGPALAARSPFIADPYSTEAKMKSGAKAPASGVDPGKVPEKNPELGSGKVLDIVESPPVVGSGNPAALVAKVAKTVVLKEFKHELLLRDPKELVWTGHKTFFPKLENLGSATYEDLLACYGEYTEGKRKVEEGFELYPLDLSTFQLLSDRGWVWRMVCQLLAGKRVKDSLGTLLVLEGIVQRVFGLASGLVDPVSGGRYVQYGPVWTPEKAAEMKAAGVAKWWRSMNPLQVEARRPRTVEDIPPGYAWVPFFGYYSNSVLERARRVYDSPARMDYGYEGQDLRKDELDFAEELRTAQGVLVNLPNADPSFFPPFFRPYGGGFEVQACGVSVPLDAAVACPDWLTVESAPGRGFWSGFDIGDSGPWGADLFREFSKIKTLIHTPSAMVLLSRLDPGVYDRWKSWGISFSQAGCP